MKFKHQRDKLNVLLLNPILLNILFDMNLYAYDNGLPFRVTDTISTIERDEMLGRTSSSHRTARAIDLSVKGWNELDIKDFKNYYNKRYEDVAAISRSDGETRLIVDHDSGKGRHFHISLHSKYSLIIQDRDIGL